MADRVDRTERLLNLVFALMAAARAVPRSVIREQVPGYADAASDAAFERMFERDKDELRSMGIPVETVVDDLGEVLGYRIPRDAYAMADLDLSMAERSAVAVAAGLWGRAALASVAGTAARKIEAALGDVESWSPVGLGGDITITASDAALVPLMQAIRLDRVVTFDYQAPTAATPLKRTVSPWRLVSTGGHWRLTGHDHDRGAERTFRLSRIAGSVNVTGRERIPVTDVVKVDDVPADGAVRATVNVAPRRGAGLRRARTPGAPAESRAPLDVEEFEVEFPTVDALMGAVLAAGPDAYLVSPPELVALVQSCLDSLEAGHAEAGA